MLTWDWLQIKCTSFCLLCFFYFRKTLDRTVWIHLKVIWFLVLNGGHGELKPWASQSKCNHWPLSTTEGKLDNSELKPAGPYWDGLYVWKKRHWKDEMKNAGVGPSRQIRGFMYEVKVWWEEAESKVRWRQTNGCYWLPSLKGIGQCCGLVRITLITLRKARSYLMSVLLPEPAGL